MRFETIAITEGTATRTINFSSNNLIFSLSNSKGKTTLLRFLLYSIGFNIPETRYINFEKCIVVVNIVLDNGKRLQLTRRSKSYIIVESEDIKTFVLPSQEVELHKILFKTENLDLLKNILGVFYFDQEKGWTLLNRGTVIGSIHFNIEELIRGLANVDCSDLLEQKNAKKHTLSKYEQMYSVSKYQETLDLQVGNLAPDTYDEKIQSQLNQCKANLSILNKELHRVDEVLKQNNLFKKYISDIGILIKTPSDEIVSVTPDNIIGLQDSIDYLDTKRKLLASQYNKIKAEYDSLQVSYSKEIEQLLFLDNEETIINIFDKTISTIPIKQAAVETAISKFKTDISSLDKEIRRLTMSASIEISSIVQSFKKYLNELDIPKADKITVNSIFTSDLKSLSGAILHKIVFSLRLACLQEVQKHLGIYIPIILDSPSGKEVDIHNIKAMIDILKRDFINNQIIIASIYDYNLPNLNKVEIINQLVEETKAEDFQLI